MVNRIHKQPIQSNCIASARNESPRAPATNRGKARPARQIPRLHNQLDRLQSDKEKLEARASELRTQIAEQEKAIGETKAKISETSLDVEAFRQWHGIACRALNSRHRKLTAKLDSQFIGLRSKAVGCTKKFDEIEELVRHRVEQSRSELTRELPRAVTPVDLALSAEPQIAANKLPTPRTSAKASELSTEVSVEQASSPIEPEDLGEWLRAQLCQLHDVEGLTAEDIKKASENIEPEVQAIKEGVAARESAKVDVDKQRAKLTALRSTLREQTARHEALNNELLSVEMQIALIQSEIDCINFIIESMKREQELAAEEARRRDEELAIQDIEERAAKQAQDAVQRFEELGSLADKLRLSEEALKNNQAKAFYKGAEADTQRAEFRLSEVRELIEDSQASTRHETGVLRREQGLIDRADIHFDAIIGHLKGLLSSGSNSGVAACSLPTGVRMSGELADAMSEMAALHNLIQTNDGMEIDDIIAASQTEARESTLQRILAGLVPEPRDIKCLAVNSNAPIEWVKELDKWVQELEKLSGKAAKNGKLKGLQEQRKMTILSQFVDFLNGLGSSNFKALLTGNSLALNIAELRDSSSPRRQKLDSVLDGLFCS